MADTNFTGRSFALEFIAALILFGIIVFLLWWRFATPSADSTLEALQRSLSPYGELQFDNAETTDEGHLILRNVRIEWNDNQTSTPLRRLTVFRYDRAHEIPEFAHLRLEGMQFHTADIPDVMVSGLLSLAGYNTLEADIELEYRVDPDGTLRFELANTMDGFADLGANGRLLHLKPQRILQSMQHVTLDEAHIALNDRGLVQRALRVAASQTRQSPDQVVDLSAQFLQGKRAIAQSANERDFWQALLDFVHSPGMLVLHVQPPQPVALSDLRFWRAEQSWEKLGIEADAREASTGVTLESARQL